MFTAIEVAVAEEIRSAAVRPATAPEAVTIVVLAPSQATVEIVWLDAQSRAIRREYHMYQGGQPHLTPDEVAASERAAATMLREKAERDERARTLALVKFAGDDEGCDREETS